jgi:gas vesicle structural protein
LADVLDTILDKGLVLDAYVRVSLVGIEILTVDARVVLASVDTYLRFAEAVNRLGLPQIETQEPQIETQEPAALGADMRQGRAQQETADAVKGALEAAEERFRELVAEQAEERKPAPRRTRRDAEEG